MEKLGGVILKPDAFERNLKDSIISDLLDLGIIIREEYEIDVRERELEVLYPSLVTDERIKSNLLLYFSRHRNLLLIVTHSDAKLDMIKMLNAWKGSKVNKTGIRGKYLEIDPKSVDKEKDADSYYKFMRENLIHTFEDYESFQSFYRLIK